MASFKKLRTWAVTLVTSSALLLSACDVVPVENDPTDSCNAFAQRIGEARKTEINDRLGNVIGAGLATGFATILLGGDQEDAVIAAVLAGASAFAISYFNDQKQRNQDSNRLLASVNRDALNERNLVSRTGKAAAALRSCRQKQVAALASKARRGSIGKDTARSELSLLKRRISGDNRLISSAFGGIDERVDAYVSATAATAQVDKALITRQRQVNATARQRQAAQQARARTPQVTSVARASNQQKVNDASRAASLDRELKALEALLS